jgi:hypothetical protein
MRKKRIFAAEISTLYDEREPGPLRINTDSSPDTGLVMPVSLNKPTNIVTFWRNNRKKMMNRILNYLYLCASILNQKNMENKAIESVFVNTGARMKWNTVQMLDKLHYRDAHWQTDLKNAYERGNRFVEMTKGK